MKRLSQACTEALSSMEEYDCDDAGINRIALIGRFRGSRWYVCQTVSYDDGERDGEYSVLRVDRPEDGEWPELGGRGLNFWFVKQQEDLGQSLDAIGLTSALKKILGPRGRA